MPACEVYRNNSVSVSFADDTGVLDVRCSDCPSTEEIDHMWTVLSTFIVNHPTQCLLHIMHVDSDRLEPPSAAVMISIASKVITDFPEVSKKCSQVIIQPKFVDSKVQFALEMFRGLVQNRFPVVIEPDAEKVKRLIDKSTRR